MPAEGADSRCRPDGSRLGDSAQGLPLPQHESRASDFTNDEGKEFIENTFFKSLEEGSVELPDGPNGEPVEVPIAKLGIQCPVVTTENPIIDVNYFPEAVGGEPGSQLMNRMPEPARGVADDEAQPVGPKIWKLRRYDFTIQFYWKPTPRTARQEKPPAAEGGESLDTVSVGRCGRPDGLSRRTQEQESTRQNC